MKRFPFRYLIYVGVLLLGYFISYGIHKKSEAYFISAKVMNISFTDSFLKEADTIFTLKVVHTDRLLQLHTSVELGKSCNIYDIATIKVIPSVSGKFSRFELVKCDSSRN